MSEVAGAEAVSSPSSGSTPSTIDAAGDGTPELVPGMPQTPSPGHAQLQPQPKSKRYTPPKADANTFPTQQAFLDSLHPMPLEEVDVDKRKCPICWKLFGEPPDPGFDNSEMPVELRCHHVFGHKCLADIFGIPASTSLQLQPLQYSLGKRGYLLGQKLAAYHTLHAAKFHDEFETFEHMLKNMRFERGPQELTSYWWVVLTQIIHSHRGLGRITLMENAVILDYAPVTAKTHQQTQPDPGIPPQFLPPASSLQQTLLGTADSMSVQMDGVGHDGDMALMTWSSSSSTSSQPTPAQSYAHLSSIQSPGTTNDLVLIDTGNSTTWEEALTGETNLDKLKALQKQKENAEQSQIVAAQKLKELKAQKAAMEEARKQEAQRAHAAMERRKHDIRTTLAHRLVEVLAEYRCSHPQEPNEAIANTTEARIIHAAVSIHVDDFERTTYTIAPPMIGPFYDEDGDSDDGETENLADATMFILRTQCGGCCTEDRTLPTPEELTWRNTKSTPDSCPLCHKVLFKKSISR